MKKLISRLKSPALKYFWPKSRMAAAAVILVLLLCLFGPLSMQTASLKAEKFLSQKFHEEAKKLKERQGLTVKWKELHVSFLPLSIRLEKPRLFPSSMEALLEEASGEISENPAAAGPDQKAAAPPGPPGRSLRRQKFFFEKAIDGVQSAEAISVHPSLLSLLFKRQISISKAQIKEGSIAVQNLSLLSSEYFKKARRKKTSLLETAKSFLLKSAFIKSIPSAPLKTLSLQNVSLSLKHEGQTARLGKIKGKLRAGKDGNYYLTALVKEALINGEGPASLALSARISKNRVFIEEASLKSESAKLYARASEALFSPKGLESLKLKSSGALPSSLIHQAILFMGKKAAEALPRFEAFLTYKTELGYSRARGLAGSFDLKGEDFSYQGLQLRSLSAKGSFKDKKILTDKGFVKTKGYSRINIKKMEWDLQKSPAEFSLSAQAKNLPFSFISEEIAGQTNFPVRASLTGDVACRGRISLDSFGCEAEMESPRIAIYGGDGGKSLVSFHDMGLSLKANMENKIIAFDLLGAKEDSTYLKISGKLPMSSKKLSLSAEGYSAFPEDTRLYLPFPIKGELYISQGLMETAAGGFKAKGELSSPLFAVSGWRLENISSRFQLQDSRLLFSGWKGSPGKSLYKGAMAIDFNKREFSLNGFFPFLDLRDLQRAAAGKFQLPFQIKGTGEASFRAKAFWPSRPSRPSMPPEKKPSFHAAGNLFNVFIKEESFQRVGFDIFSKGGNGIVKSLTAAKGPGLIESSGYFDENFNLNLDFKGQNLYLEQMETLNSAVPLNQSGAADFQLKVTGPIARPKAAGEFSIKNAFLYTYPVDETKMKINIDKDRFFLSGSLMNDISVKRLSGSFARKSPLVFEGSFKNWDVIKAFSAKSQNAETSDYSSKLTGECSLLIGQGQKTASGKISVKDLVISKGNQQLKSERPFSLSLKDSQWQIDPAAFSHHNKKTLEIRQNEDGRLLVSGQSSLGLFSAFLPFLRGLDGDIRASLQMENSLKPSNPRGWIQIENGFFSLGRFPDFINIRSFIKAEGGRIHISRFESSAGGGSVSAKDAVLSYSFSDPPSVNIPLKFSHINLNFPEGFRTEGSGSINISGDRPPYLLSGSYLIHSGNITKNFSRPKAGIKHNLPAFEKKSRKKPSLFGLNIKVKAENPVSINNDLIHSSLEGNVDIQGPLKSPLLSGGFRLSKKRESHFITFRGQEFSITSGRAIFRKSPPDNPILDIKAQTLFESRAMGAFANDQDETEEYWISLAISGPANALDFSLSSLPSINEKEIISLLALGAGSRYFDANLGENVTDYSYQLLGSFLLQSKLNREFKNTLGLNLDLAPHINENNEPVTKIILKKSWFDRLKTSVSRTLEEFPASDARLRYVLKKNISLTGFWEHAEQKQESAQNEKMGFDFEFKLDF